MKSSLRFEREKPHLNVLPRGAFDTSCRVYRKVRRDCTVRFESSSCVVPHTLVEKSIIPRVKDSGMRVFDDNCLAVTYEIPEGRGSSGSGQKILRSTEKRPGDEQAQIQLRQTQ